MDHALTLTSLELVTTRLDQYQKILELNFDSNLNSRTVCQCWTWQRRQTGTSTQSLDRLMCPTQNILESSLSSSLEVSSACYQGPALLMKGMHKHNNVDYIIIFLRPWGLLLDLGDWLPQLLCCLLLHGDTFYFLMLFLLISTWLRRRQLISGFPVWSDQAWVCLDLGKRATPWPWYGEDDHQWWLWWWERIGGGDYDDDDNCHN